LTSTTTTSSLTDLESVNHRVDVTATTLYEAITLGLAALRDSGWVAGIPEGLAAVRVSVTPKDVSNRDRIRAILGLPR
jgi:hypothetical protein